MLKAILFDVGGVIIDFSNDDDYYPYLSRISGVSIKRIKKIIEGKLWVLLDKDKISQKDFDKIIARKLKICENKVLWYETYEKEGKLDKKVINDIKKLSKHYKIAYLSNVDMSRYCFTLKMLKPYSKLFNHEFASCYIHLRKPEKKAFGYVLSKLKVKPSEAVFIDNQEENVAGAKRAGLKTILFKDNKGMEKDLLKLGVRL